MLFFMTDAFNPDRKPQKKANWTVKLFVPFFCK